MDLKSLESKLGVIASTAAFDSESKEALRLARDIIAATRAAHGLSSDCEAKGLVDLIRSAADSPQNVMRYRWLRSRMTSKDVAIFAQRSVADEDAAECVDSSVDRERGSAVTDPNS